nr:PAAR domain-containing protein [Klebsiella quasipneumoniae]
MLIIAVLDSPENRTSASSSFEISGKILQTTIGCFTCPYHGTNNIIECDFSAYEENGRGVVIHHCKTQCGAVVIASLQDMEIG